MRYYRVLPIFCIYFTVLFLKKKRLFRRIPTFVWAWISLLSHHISINNIKYRDDVVLKWLKTNRRTLTPEQDAGTKQVKHNFKKNHLSVKCDIQKIFLNNFREYLDTDMVWSKEPNPQFFVIRKSGPLCDLNILLTRKNALPHMCRVCLSALYVHYLEVLILISCCPRSRHYITCCF